MVQCLPSVSEALGIKPSTTKNNINKIVCGKGEGGRGCENSDMSVFQESGDVEGGKDSTHECLGVVSPMAGRELEAP